jgi:hypothetical protein
VRKDYLLAFPVSCSPFSVFRFPFPPVAQRIRMFYTHVVGILVGNGGLSRVLFLIYPSISSYTGFWATIISVWWFMPNAGFID